MQCISDVFKKQPARRISSSVFFDFSFDRFCFHLGSFPNSDIFFVFFRRFFENFSRNWRKSSMSTSFYKVSSRMLLVLYFFSNRRFKSLIPCESFFCFFLKIYRSNLRKSLRLLFFFDSFCLLINSSLALIYVYFHAFSINFLLILRKGWFCEWGENVTSS